MKKGDLFNYEKIENGEYWQNIKQSILNSNKSINEKEFDVIVKTEFKNFLSEICNSITHNNEEKYFNENEEHLGDKMYSATQNGINDAFTKFKIIDDEFLSINVKYHSAKLNKTLDFNLSGGDISNLIEICRQGINRDIGFSVEYDSSYLFLIHLNF